MKFGRLPSYTGVDFRLPALDPDAARSDAVAADALALFAGCPVWAEDGWLGDFLPSSTARGDRLKEYALRLPAVELNSTFYAMPSPATFRRWRDQVPGGFRFCPKVPSAISRGLERGRTLRSQHHHFWDAVGQLDGQLGTAFLQLPPSFSPREIATLEGFVRDVPAGRRLAVEFRHPGWFDGGRLTTRAASVLRAAGVATVVTDCAGRRDVCHATLTADSVVIRFAGTGIPTLDGPRLTDWVQRLGVWRDNGLTTAFMFTHFPLERGGPQAARQLMAAANGQLGLSLPLWEAPRAQGQLSLL